MIRSMTAGILLAASTNAVTAQAPAATGPSPALWISGGIGRYQAFDPASDYEPASSGDTFGHRSVWGCLGRACLTGRVSRGAAPWGGSMNRDEGAFMVGGRVRRPAWQAAAGAGISRLRLENYFMAPGQSDPASLERKESGVALGGELTRAGSFAGIGLGLMASMTPHARYAAMTATLQLGWLK